MKKLILTLFITGAVLRAPAAGIPVFDWSNLMQSILQVMLASNQVAQADEMLRRLGDPAAIRRIAGAALTLNQLGAPGVAITLPDIQINSTGQAGQSYDGNGLYRPVEPEIETTPGRKVPRAPEAYRKFEALQGTVDDYNAVIADTQARRDALREAERQTAEQIKAAKTDSEVQKLRAVQAVQQSALNSVNAERTEATAKVVIQQASNEADRERQAQADLELRTASIQSALKDALRLFKVDSRHTRIPAPRSIAL